MTDCTATTHDRWRTLYHCQLEAHETGPHVADGFQWHPDAALVPKRVPIAYERYDGTRESARLVPFVASVPREDLDYYPISIAPPPGNDRPRLVWPGEYVVVYDDGTVEVLAEDRFRAQFRLPESAPSVV